MFSVMAVRRKTIALLLFTSVVIFVYFWYRNDGLSKYVDVKKMLPANVFDDVHHKEKVEVPFWQKQLCDWRNTSLNVKRETGFIFDISIISRDVMPDVSPDNIFLLETSCNPQPSFREWCSIESWANQNPKKIVWYIVTSPFINDKSGLARDLLLRNPNLNVVGCDISEIMSETPMKELFESNKWFTDSLWPHIHLSDMVRYQLLWHFGGFYTDTDAICIKDTKSLVNVIGTSREDGMGNGIIHANPRHKILWKFMEYVSKNYEGKVYAANGPIVVTSVLKKECSNSFSSSSECNMTILPQSSFYLFPYYQAIEYFQERKDADPLQLFRDSYTIHFFNQKSKKMPIRISSNSIMENAARKFCPVTFEVATRNSDFF